MKQLKRIVIILPTYNEKENIVSILTAITSQKILNGKISVLVVDDSSPDGTGKIVKQIAQKNKNVHLLTGKKEGLGAAYIRGFNHAVNKMKADIIFEMDADFSHDPNLIPAFVKQILYGADIVIGSRYIPGGTIPANWSFLRKANSKWGNIFARYVGGMQGVKDCTSGYRAINVTTLKKVNLENLNTKGYSFQVSLLYALIKSDAVVYELPIQFVDRVRGKSKIRLTDITEFVWFTVKLRANIFYMKYLEVMRPLTYEKTFNR